VKKQTKLARRKKREKAMLKMEWYKNWDYTRYRKAKLMYEGALKQRHPYTKSNF
jgi:hypothetical protein